MASRPIHIVVDAMGGDVGPKVNVSGAFQAVTSDKDLRISLVGDSEKVQAELAQCTKDTEILSRLNVVHSTEHISMDDHAANAIRRKKNSSLHIGLSLVQEGKADAFISAGNSGAVMAGALLLVGRLEGVERPAILIRLPTAEGFVTILDAGANVDCRPEHLAQFALMGHLYANVVEGIQKPRVALLANGSETHKGNEVTRAAHTLLQKSRGITYIGYVEGHDLFHGRADVIVCDGFVGNVVLKVSEGLAETAFQWFRTEIKSDLVGMLGLALMKNLLRKFRNKFDYQPYGAAPLVGINGVVMISHGGSSDVAIRNGIFTAKKAVEAGFVQKMKRQLNESSQGMSTEQGATI